MTRQVASITGCLMLGGLMMIPLTGILRSGARNWHRQPTFAPVAAGGGSFIAAQTHAPSVRNASRAVHPAYRSSGSSRGGISPPTILADDYVLYWRTADYTYPDIHAGALRPSNGPSLTAPPHSASGHVLQPASYGAPQHRIGDLRNGSYVLQGSSLRVTDADSDEAIRLGATLIGGGLGTGLVSDRVGAWLYLGPFNQANVSAGASALRATSSDADFGGIDGGALEPVTPTLTSSSSTVSRNLDNVVIASSDRSPGRSGAGIPLPTRYDPSSPFGPAAPNGSSAASSQGNSAAPTPSTPSPPVAAGESQSPVRPQPTGARPSGGATAQPSQPGVAPDPRPAPFPLPLPADAQPPVAPPPLPAFADTGDNSSNPPSTPPTVPRPSGGSLDPIPPNTPAFPPAAPPQPAGNSTQPPAQPPVFPDFIPPLADAIASSDGALPNAPPALPVINGDWPGKADPPPATTGLDRPIGTGSVATPTAQVDEEFAAGWSAFGGADFGFGAVPEPGSMILLLTGAAMIGRRARRSQ